MKRKVFIAILVILLILQFVQPPKNNGPLTSASDITHAVAVPDSVMSILRTSCYDCHSDHTEYPWYNHITPVNWWLYNHIKDGKRGLNFTNFTGSFRRKIKKLEETEAMVAKDRMPLKSYLIIHTDARLNDEQKNMIALWAKTSREKLLEDSLSR